jgi:hypothetical protein
MANTVLVKGKSGCDRGGLYLSGLRVDKEYLWIIKTLK